MSRVSKYQQALERLVPAQARAVCPATSRYMLYGAPEPGNIPYYTEQYYNLRYYNQYHAIIYHTLFMFGIEPTELGRHIAKHWRCFLCQLWGTIDYGLQPSCKRVFSYLAH